MAALSTRRSVSMPVSIPHRAVSMATCDAYEDKTAASSLVKQEYRRLMKNSRSTSENKSHKPMWWFLLNRTGQAAAMRKIASLHKTAPDLTWEEKWVVTEASLRDSCTDQMIGIDEAIIYIQRSLVYEGDSPLPDLFTGCITDDDRLSALLARPSPQARIALRTFWRRTVSGQSITSSFDAQDATVDAQKPSGKDEGEAGEPAEATRSADPEDEKRDGCESEHADEVDEEDPIWEALVKSCSLNYGTFC